MHISRISLPLILICIATGCANLNTINRETSLSEKDSDGKAIHLDVQQRVVMVNSALKYCAEPSPDALAAYSSSLGLSLSDPTGKAASLSQGGQSNAASIGLRTQSITLMRDALYRMCEAHANGGVSSTEVAIFLSKSQDLTAVLLAVEQLTGAIKANPVTLTSSTNSSSLATLLSNQKVLEQAREYEDKKKKVFEENTAEFDSLKTELSTAKVELASRQSTYDTAHASGSTATQQQKDDATIELEKAKTANSLAQQKVDLQSQAVSSSKTHYEEAKANRILIEQNKDSALASTSSMTNGAANIDTVTQARNLSDNQTLFVSRAVENMVNSVINKSYINEFCIASIGSTDPEIKLTCLEIFKAQLKISLNELRAHSSFSISNTTELLTKKIKADPTLSSKIAKWLIDNGHSFSTTTLIYGSDQEDLRSTLLKSSGLFDQTNNQ